MCLYVYLFIYVCVCKFYVYIHPYVKKDLDSIYGEIKQVDTSMRFYRARQWRPTVAANGQLSLR